MPDFYGPSKRILYHLDGTMAFYRTTANEYFEMSAANLALLNRDRGDTGVSTPPSPGKDFTFYFPTTMWLQGIFINDALDAPFAFDGKTYFPTREPYEIWVSPNTTGLDDGDWYQLPSIENGQNYVTYFGSSSADNTLWAYRQMIQELWGQYALNVRALRIVMTPQLTARIHLYGVPVDPTPLLGDLVLVRDDGTPLSADDLWLGGLKQDKGTSETETGDVNYSPEVSFRVRNDSPRTALGASVQIGYLQPVTGFDWSGQPMKEVRVDSGAWVESNASIAHVETVGDLAPGETSDQLFTYRLRQDPVMYYFSSWTVAYAPPVVILPQVTGWSG